MAPLPHSTFGALIICTTFSAFLLAIQHYQVYLYLKRFWGRDSRYFRYNVIVVTVIDTLHQIFCLYTLYLYLVAYISRPRLLQRFTCSIAATLTAGLVLSYLVQMFYARRCWLLNKKRVFWAHVHLGFGLWFTAATVMVKTIAEYINLKRRYLSILCAESAAVCDVLVTYAVISQLAGTKTGFRSTDRGIKRLIAFTFGTGTLTSVVACTVVVVFLTGLDYETLGIGFLLCRSIATVCLPRSINVATGLSILTTSILIGLKLPQIEKKCPPSAQVPSSHRPASNPGTRVV
ncbi:uncharacterized protein EI90DRAFT_1349213 [Cantharellus anzutake]|uniref:uncharacterized protein n=1 Tax=Cantharellus anzutake TaxID=1750568 RepID=UPI0019037C8F|nr:uncharacterized protein EI90DRAFT_1349213 [Cantharellus anzutake]KAF8329823.1 hypothetical protein EI90DRAFT_1349213 [Cantharellus anzutake]